MCFVRYIQRDFCAIDDEKLRWPWNPGSERTLQTDKQTDLQKISFPILKILWEFWMWTAPLNGNCSDKSDVLLGKSWKVTLYISKILSLDCNKIAVQSKAGLVTLVWPWPWPDDFDSRPDPDILKMYLHTKTKFLDEGFRKLEPRLDRQTDRSDGMYYNAAPGCGNYVCCILCFYRLRNTECLGPLAHKSLNAALTWGLAIFTRQSNAW